MQFHSGLIYCFALWLVSLGLMAQTDSSELDLPNGVDTLYHGVKQQDLFDVLGRISPKLDIDQEDEFPKDIGVMHFSALPVLAYSIQTGVLGGVTGNLAFFTDSVKDANISNVVGTAAYSVKRQTIVILQPSIWSKGNKYNLFGDIVYLKFPQETFGLGGTSRMSRPSNIDYSYLRTYMTLVRRVFKDGFMGVGYHYDYHWNIKQVEKAFSEASDFDKYGLGSTETSSGISYNFVFDNRRNMINPQRGAYASFLYRQNFKALGSESNWRAIVVDLRTYLHPSKRSKNVLALWTYAWCNFNTSAPYLDLPSSGWDNYGNTGRGYEQGRFRGKNMLYAEMEYRYRITRNGLIGGVLFLNGQSFTDWPSNRFTSIHPGYGVGLRIKVNRNSGTNVALDYGFGDQHSHGLFVNLCEMF